ncbi:MAG: DUF1295 domain-containing protein [Spirochaetaceae bacterium]|nr:DUF1295 domain-containing protein [Spirochaetaceae bacterium]
MNIYLILAAVSLLITAIGFRYYIHFFSVGYGFAIAGLALAMFVLFIPNLTLPTIIMCVLLVAYGIRLGGYLLYRERKTPAYNQRVSGDIKDGNKVPFVAKVSIWISCALLYLLMTCPLLFRLQQPAAKGEPLFDVPVIIGIALMVIGILMEIIADKQKSDAKKTQPGRFVDTGLYRFVRCPNYLGELLLWTGVFVSGVNKMSTWQWIPAILGLVLIVYVMLSGARRLELRQNKSYGDDPEYQKYVQTVPIIIPFIPLYSVIKYKFLVA